MMKQAKPAQMLLGILLVFALLLNFSACRMQEIACGTLDSTIKSPFNDNLPEIQAINLMQGIESGIVEGQSPDEAFINAQLSFALALFKGSFAESEDENMLVSPLSVMLALAMTANGADGETKAEMERLLGGELSLEELNKYLYSYVNALPSDEKYKVEIANSIWFRDDEEAITVERDFLQTNADYYGASAYKAPFDEQTVKDINNWVDQNTDGMIDEIVEKIDPLTVMYLINALVFDAEWSDPYNEYQVREGSFTTVKGEVQMVDMMHSDEWHYLSDGSATGFIKPYADGKYAFAALLPNEEVDLHDYIASQTVDSLRQTLMNVEYHEVNATMPKFSYEYEIEMNDLLSGLGIPTAFDEDEADFSKLGQSSYGNIYIGRVLHKTHIELAERGTRAGAVTSVEMNPEGAMPTEPYTVTLDRPFVYFILDTDTNLPIFMGAVMDINN